MLQHNLNNREGYIRIIRVNVGKLITSHHQPIIKNSQGRLLGPFPVIIPIHQWFTRFNILHH